MSIVKTALKEEIVEKLNISKKLKIKIDSAKTETKKKYYLKKLKENNNILADLLIAFNKINR